MSLHSVESTGKIHIENADIGGVFFVKMFVCVMYKGHDCIIDTSVVSVSKLVLIEFCLCLVFEHAEDNSLKAFHDY